MPDPTEHRHPRPPRWGLRTLLFLILAAGSVVVSNAAGQYTLLTLAALLVGFGGAIWCTVRGLAAAFRPGALHRTLSERRSAER